MRGEVLLFTKHLIGHLGLEIQILILQIIDAPHYEKNSLKFLKPAHFRGYLPNFNVIASTLSHVQAVRP
jgi:hypothetical protein